MDDDTPPPPGGRIRSFRDLIVWQRSMELDTAVHELLHATPPRLTRGLTIQLIKSSESIGSNIAEGHGRPTRAEYLYFCGVAHASLCECQKHLLTLRRARGVRNHRTAHALALSDEIKRMLSRLMTRLREGLPPDHPRHISPRDDPAPPSSDS